MPREQPTDPCTPNQIGDSPIIALAAMTPGLCDRCVTEAEAWTGFLLHALMGLHGTLC